MNSIVCDVTPGLLEPVTSPLIRSRVVVFDIDLTLGTPYCGGGDKLEIVRKNYSECPIISYTVGNYTDEFVFLPYLHILFEYLLKEDVRIVFFSAGDKRRNPGLIAGLLISFWGTEQFEALKAKGQFDTLSIENMREGNHLYDSGEGNYVKDLKAVIRDGETLSDVILVDDDSSFVAYDQKPFLKSYNLISWYIRNVRVNHTTKAADLPLFMWMFIECPDFPLNSVYYMLGVFKRYFENEIYKILPLKEGINQIVPEIVDDDDFFVANSFAYEMYDLGLSEVQKWIPNATFYGYRYPHAASNRSN